MALPTGTVTFLFTDIERSSRLWELHPEAMRAAVAQHDAHLQAAVLQNGGHVVKMRGDGLHAVFASALDAVAAAIAGQRALKAAQWDETTGPLQVRMGLHTGTAELRDGDYFGLDVNRAARLQDAAHGGQVLLSEVAAGLVREHLPDDLSLLDLGPHRFKDIPEPVHIFQLVAGDLRRAFPPLRATGAARSNLPAQATSFIGRRRELSEAKRLLAEARLVTLIGPGGAGKTRLALQAAAELRDDYRDGVWLAELAPLSDETMIIPAVAAVFSLQSQPGLSQEDVLADFLRGKELLLLLDNCEHLIERCAVLAATFLDLAPRLTILASSREALGVPGERIMRVPSLAVPPASEITVATLQTSEAAQLLVDRAIAVRPEFQLSDDNAVAVAEICRRLDGIPLAIELAAARLRLLSPQQIAERLNDRFRLLTGGSRTAVPRQQTLQALIDWSYDLLEPEEKDLFRRLSVFAGGWSFEAAEAIGDGLDVLELLDQLVSKSLVQVEEEGGHSRYRYLETIRQYARDRLFATGEGEAMRDRHFAYFSRLVAAIESRLGGETWEESIVTLRSEGDNLHQAVEWGLERDVIAAVDLLAAAVAFGIQSSELPVGVVQPWMQRAWARLEALPPRVDEHTRRQRAWARLYLVAGLQAMNVGDYEGVRSNMTSAIELSRIQDDRRTLMVALGFFSLSAVLRLGDRIAAAQEYYSAAQECLALARELDDAFYEGMALNVINGIELARGELELGQVHVATTVRGTPFFSAVFLFQSAMMIVRNAEDPAAALPVFQESLRRFQHLSHTRFIASSESEIAHIHRQAGDLDAAEATYRQTIAKFHWLGHRAAIAHQLECFAYIARARGRSERAATLFGAAEALRAAIATEMLPYEREEYEREIAALRQELDTPNFERAWSAGGSLSIDHAIEFALSDYGKGPGAATAI